VIIFVFNKNIWDTTVVYASEDISKLQPLKLMIRLRKLHYMIILQILFASLALTPLHVCVTNSQLFPQGKKKKEREKKEKAGKYKCLCSERKKQLERNTAGFATFMTWKFWWVSMACFTGTTNNLFNILVILINNHGIHLTFTLPLSTSPFAWFKIS